jgi:methyl-accepting chemotaxis protein
MGIMNWIDNQPLRVKLTLAPGFLLLVFVVASIYAYVALSFSERSIVELQTDVFAKGYAFDDSWRSLESVHADLYRMTSFAASESDTKRIAALAKETGEALNSQSEKLMKLVKDGDLPSDLAAGLEKNLKAYVKTGAKAVDMADTDASTALTYMTTAARQFKPLRESLEKVSDHYNEVAQQKSFGVRSSLAQSRLVFEVLAGIDGILAMVIAFVIGRAIATPLSQIISVMRRLADNDLSVSIQGHGRRDEIGEMAKTIAIFKQNAQAKLSADEAQIRARADAERLQNDIAARERADRDKLDVRTRQVESTIRAFEDESNRALAGFGQSAQEMNEIALKLRHLIDTAAQASNIVGSSAAQAFNNVEVLSAATEEMVASIRDITGQVGQATISNQHAVEATGTAKGQVETLRLAAERIGQIVTVISDVAERIDLLALNATIEAARAGDAGKGFAVVASEVKQLAAQTARATEEIASQIRDIQDSTISTVASIGEVSNAIDRASEFATSIAAALEEQAAATQEIARNAQEASQGTRAVSQEVVKIVEANQQSGAASEGVNRSMESVLTKADELRGNINQFISKVRAI